jgi:hypothetical protein
MKIGLVSAAAMAVLVLSSSAFAQTPASAPAAATKPAAASPAPAATTTTTNTTSDYVEQRTGGDQVVTFGGDPLDGDPNSAYGFTIRRPPGILRANLIRPRVNFVSELLKSVENL